MEKFRKYEVVMEFVEALREWSEEEGGDHPVAYEGICDRLYVFGYELGVDYSDDIVSAFAQDWEKYSGNDAFPVPDPRAVGPGACGLFYDTVYLWGDTEYGDLRRELCASLADSLEEHMEELIRG